MEYLISHMKQKGAYKHYFSPKQTNKETNLKEIVVIVIAVARHSLQFSHSALKWLTTQIKEGFSPVKRAAQG